MPHAVIGGAIAAVGGVASAAIGSKSAKKASQAQTSASNAQIAAAKENRDYLYRLATPDLSRGQAAGDTISGLLNIGGDPAKSAAALDQFRASSGYQDIVREGLGAVNANAYARGMGQSGAAFKALQDRGASLANRSYGDYIGQLTNVANRGTAALGVVGGVGTNFVNQFQQASQNAADAKGNAALVGGNLMSGAINGLLNAGAYAYGSSYQSSGVAAGGTPGYGGGAGIIPPYYRTVR